MNVQITQKNKNNNSLNDLNLCKQKLKEIQLKYKKEKENCDARKNEESITIKITDNIKEKLLNDTQRKKSEDEIIIISNQNNSKLQSAIRESLEIVHVSDNIKHELNKQNNDLNMINNKVNKLGFIIDNSNSLVRRIMNGRNRNKIILSLFSFTLVFMFILVLYSKF